MSGHSEERKLASADTNALRDGAREAPASLGASAATASRSGYGADTMHTAELVEANERLVLAALDAQAAADRTATQLEALTRSSQRDALTGLPNRALMRDRIGHAIAMARRKGTRSAILFLDIDDIKHINDTLGHAAGDSVLRLLARRLEALVRESDTVSRHGGDEFLILLAEVSNAADAELMARKIRASLANPRSIVGPALALSVSIGIAIYPDHGEDADTLICCADASMYRAKNRSMGVEKRPQSETEAGDTSDALSTLGRLTQEPVGQSNQFRELREANEELVLAALSAQKLQAAAESALRREIGSLATLAHELRHPLAPILTAAALLKRIRMQDPLLPRIQEVIERQAIHMTRLVDDLLDSARLSSGKFRLDRRQVDLAAILQQAVETCRPAMDRLRQRFELRLPSSMLLVYGDPDRLVQVFVNLLHNACKYTPEDGAIAICAAILGNEIEVRVWDSGIGITAEALPHVFELFAQDPRGLQLSNDGLGIGLAVVRELVESHDGSVTASSDGKDFGCTFVVTLPMSGTAAELSDGLDPLPECSRLGVPN